MKRIAALFAILVTGLLSLPASATAIRTDFGACGSTPSSFGGPFCWNGLAEKVFTGAGGSLVLGAGSAFDAAANVSVDLDGTLTLNQGLANELTFQAIDISAALTGLGLTFNPAASRIVVDFGRHDTGNDGFLTPDFTQYDPTDNAMMRVTWHFKVTDDTYSPFGVANQLFDAGSFDASVQLIIGYADDQTFFQLAGLNGAADGYTGPTYSSDALWMSLNNPAAANGRTVSDCFTFDATGKPLCSTTVVDPGNPQDPNTVPEPSGLLLLGVGLLALARTRRALKSPL